MFERIPFVIFDIIHSYLSHYEYQMFLNTSRDIFAEVKYETVYYCLKQFDDWQEFDDWQQFTNASETLLMPEQMHSILETIKRNVKSQQSQISVRWFCSSLDNFITFTCLVADIHCLTLTLVHISTLPLHNLTNIRNLTLSGLSNTSLEGLSGAMKTKQACQQMRDASIRVLKLTDCINLEDISELEQLPLLRKVIIVRCLKVQDVSFLANIDEVELLSVKDMSYVAGYKQTSLTLHAHRCLGFESATPCERCDTSSLSSFRHLTNLSLSCYLHPSCNFLTAFGVDDASADDDKRCLIRNLTIENYSDYDDDNVFPVFPQLYYLTSIDITGFDLSSWNETFTSLSSVILCSCILPSTLSCFKFVSKLRLEVTDVVVTLNFSDVFHNLQKLAITRSKCLKSLIINSNIKHLEFRWNESLHTISNIGIVKSLTVHHCYKLIEINGLEKASSVDLYGLDSLADFSFLSKVSAKVVIWNCRKFIKSSYESFLEDIPDVNLKR
jgi:hypothetical protein